MLRTSPHPARHPRRLVGLTVIAALMTACLSTAVNPAPAQADSSTLISGSVQQAMIAASAQAASSGQSVPVDAATDVETTLTANPDGTFTQNIAAAPVRVQQNGAWVPLDPTLHQNSDGTWSTDATTATLDLSGGGSTGSTLASMDDDGQSLAFTWPTALPAPTVTGSTAVYSGILPGVDLQVTANSQGGFTDLVVINTPAAAQNPALDSLTLGTTASSGLTLSTDAAGDISAVDANGDMVYHSPAPVMYDSGTSTTATASPAATSTAASSPSASTTPTATATTGADTQAMGVRKQLALDTTSAATGTPAASPSESVSTTPSASSSADAADGATAPGAGATSAPVGVAVSAGSITLTPDKALLDNPAAVFPIVLDPSLTPEPIGHTTALSHYTYIQQGCPSATNYDSNDTYDQYGIGAGYQGYATCDGTERAVYMFNIGTFIDNDQIISATMNVDETYIASDGCTSATVSAYAVPEISSSTDWNNFNNASATWTDSQTVGGANRTGCAGNTATSFKVADALSTTANGIATVELRGNESDETLFKRFAKTASLSFTYNTTPNQPTQTQTSPTPVSPASQGCTTDSTKWGWIPNAGSGGDITLTANVTDPDGQWGQQIEGRFSFHDITAGTTPIQMGQDSGNLYTGLTSTDDSGAVSSGSTVSKRIPTTDLVDGHTYGWYASTWDGYSQSTDTPACYFKYDASAPTIAVNGTSSSGSCSTGPKLTEGTPSTITLTGTDTESGLKGFAYAWQDASTLAAGGGTPLTPTNGSAALTFTPSSWGTYTLWMDATDNAGNQSAAYCYSFNVTYTPGSSTPISGDITGQGKPDVVAADTAGNLDMWSTSGADTSTTAGGTITPAATVDISPVGNGPDTTGSWSSALAAHGLTKIITSTPTPDDLWALSSDRQNLYYYINIANTPASKATPPPPYYTSTHRELLDSCSASCGTHPMVGTTNIDWSNVNQLLAVGDLNNDRDPDLVTEEAGGRLYALYTNGAGLIGTIQLLGTNPAWDNWTFLSPGNTAADGGVAQLWARDNTTGTLWEYPLTLNTSTGTDTLAAPVQISATGAFPASAYPQVLSVGDITGDGLPDLVATTANGSLIDIPNTGTTTTPAFSSSTAIAPLQGPGWARGLTALDSNPAPIPASGPLTLVVANGTLCMDDPNANQTAGTAIWDYACNGSPAQQWTLQPDGTVQAQNGPEASSACLTATTGNGQSVTLQPCTDSALQQWQVTSNGSLVNTGAGTTTAPECLADPKSNPAPDTDLITWSCDNGTEQTFALPGNGTTSHWALDDSANSTTANNSASSNDATVNGGVTFGPVTDTNSVSKSAATFDGTTGDLTSTATAINTTSSYTVSAWADLTNTPSFATVLSQAGSQVGAFYLQYTGGTWRFVIPSSDSTSTTVYYTATATTTAATKQWTHLTAVYNATNNAMSLYINGQLAATATDTTPWSGSGHLYIGAAVNTGNCFPGSIADVQTYNRALTSRQILDLYDTGTSTD